MVAGDVDVRLTKNNGKGCAIFDGVDDNVTITNNSFLNPKTVMSASVWVKGPAVAGKAIFTKYDTSNIRSWQIVDSNTTAAKFRVTLSQDGTTNNIRAYDSSVTVFDNKWHHLAFTFDGATQTVLLYIDGVVDPAQTAITVTGTLTSIYENSTVPVHIGASYLAGAKTNYFAGCIKRCKMWKRTLTAAEIAQDYNGATIPLGLVVEYPLMSNYNDVVSGYNGSNSGSVLSIVDDAIQTAVAAQRTSYGATSKFYIVKGQDGQLTTVAIDE